MRTANPKTEFIQGREDYFKPMVRKPIIVATVTLSLLLVAVLLISTVATLTVSISPQRISQLLAKHNLDYELDFSEVRLSWQVRQNKLEFQFNSVEVRGPGGDIEAQFPQLLLHTAPSSLITNELKDPSFTIVEPKIRLERTAGGALKIDIGQTTDGFAGSFVLDILTDMASYSGRPWAESVSPTLNIRQANLFLADEASGSQFSFDPADISLWTDANGVHGDLALEVVTIGERVSIDLVSVFDTSDQSYSVQAALSNLNPAILARLLPNISLLKPVEIALDIKLDAQLDRHFSVQKANVFASGSDGSLEVSSLIGRNVELRDFSTNVKVERDGPETTFDIASLKWSGNRLLGQIVHSGSGPLSSQLHLDLTLVNRSWTEIAPKWFSQLSLANLPDTEVYVTEILPQRLAVYIGQDGAKAIRGAGTIYVPNLSDHADGDSLEIDKELFLIGMEVQGTRQSPVFRFDPVIETLRLTDEIAEDCRFSGIHAGKVDPNICMLQYVPDPQSNSPLIPLPRKTKGAD